MSTKLEDRTKHYEVRQLVMACDWEGCGNKTDLSREGEFPVGWCEVRLNIANHLKNQYASVCPICSEIVLQGLKIGPEQ